MKKKFLLTLLAIVCAFCCALGLAACGSEDDDKTDDEQKVTAEQWSASVEAFESAPSFTITTGTNTFMVDGNKLHLTMGANEMIFAKDGDEYYQYLKEGANGQWTKQSISEQQYTQSMNRYKTNATTIAKSFKGDYSAFSYKDGKYTAASIDKTASLGGDLRNVVVTFKNNKLVSVTFVADLDAPNVTYKLEAIGSTTIPLPNVQPPAKMTEQEWQDCLAAFADGKNFSLRMTVSGNEVGAMKLNGTTYYDTVDGQERLFVKNGSNYVKYLKWDANSNWTMTNISETQYNNSVKVSACDLVDGGAMAVAAAYSSFEYSDGKYTAATITITQDFTITNVEITVNNGDITKIVCTWVGSPSKLVTINNIGTTDIEPVQVEQGITITCPIQNGDQEGYPAGTELSLLYKEYPSLINQYGKWDVYMYYPSAPHADNDGYIKINMEDRLPEGTSKFKLVFVFNNKEDEINAEKVEDVEFTIEGFIVE